jgi:hypothetical protein
LSPSAAQSGNFSFRAIDCTTVALLHCDGVSSRYAECGPLMTCAEAGGAQALPGGGA